MDEAKIFAQRLFEGVIQVLKDHHDFYESYYCDAKRPSDSWLHTYIWSGIVARMLIDLSNVSGVITRDNQTPVQFELYQNYPNPFNLSTTIKFSLIKEGKVTLRVFDVIGREVKILLNEEKPAGETTIVFNAKNLVSGMYFYTIQSGDFRQTKKMILLK
jgi:hypothetical protein